MRHAVAFGLGVGCRQRIFLRDRIERFVGDTPWAHLDIAGTAMGSPSTDINQSWASGFGVRLLDELVRANYEG